VVQRLTGGRDEGSSADSGFSFRVISGNVRPPSSMRSNRSKPRRRRSRVSGTKNVSVPSPSSITGCRSSGRRRSTLSRRRAICSSRNSTVSTRRLTHRSPRRSSSSVVSAARPNSSGESSMLAFQRSPSRGIDAAGDMAGATGSRPSPARPSTLNAAASPPRIWLTSRAGRGRGWSASAANVVGQLSRSMATSVAAKKNGTVATTRAATGGERPESLLARSPSARM
jgi:hypothetical protein